MQLTWQELIDRARTYCDDDHDDDRSWISDERWLQLANVEYQQLYRRWIRLGLVTPAITQAYMTGPTTSFTGVLALVGVAKDFGDFVRLLTPAQETTGHDAFWRGSTAPQGCSTKYAATGTGDTLTIELDPVPNDLVVGNAGASNYIVRYVPTVARATDPTTTIELPFGGDERLVLGLAQRAGLKDRSGSAALNKLIMDADAEIAFHAASKTGSPRVKVKPRRPALQSTPRSPIWPVCSQWLYL